MQSVDEVKEYLGQIRRMENEIWIKKWDRAELRSKARSTRSIDYSRERVQTSPSGDAIPRILSQIEEVEEEIAAATRKLEQTKAEIRENIDCLENEVEREILILKYFEGRTYSEMAEKIGCVTRTIARRHNSGLSNFLKILQEKGL